MPKTTSQRLLFTSVGVLLMATTMAIYNKYLVYGGFSVQLFRQVLTAFVQKAPVAFILQFFFVQRFAGKWAERYPTDNKILYYIIRTGFTVMVMCPVMSLYSNIIIMFQFGYTVPEMIAAWIPKLVINWAFAFGVQVFILGPATRFLFRLLMKLNK